MKTLYFDCFAGASGDMILGGLVGLGVDPRVLERELEALEAPGWELRFSQVDRSGISAERVEVVTEEGHSHRHLRHILEIIERSRLSPSVKRRASAVFTRLGEAEARVHQVPIEKIHFHEVGALDAIVDIVGACIGFELLGVQRFVSSPLHVGSGFVQMAHGRFPVPPPAVTDLLAGAPVYATDITGELVTPTGAAIISTVCESYGPIPRMTISATGYGAGGRTYEGFPNVLRLMLGEAEAVATSAVEQLILMETNLDDVAPHVVGYVMDELLAAGALDCFVTPIQMKKNRPAMMVSVLCARDRQEELQQILFTETPTLGIRVREVERVALEREIVAVMTKYGPIDVKVGRLSGGQEKVAAEYEHCRTAAKEHRVPLREVEVEAVRAYHESRRKAVAG